MSLSPDFPGGEAADPFAELENLAKRQEAEKNATQAITVARTRLVLGRDAKSVFFATLALRLRPVIDWSIDTMATDGKRLLYNPDFTNRLPKDEVLGVVAHEVMHCSNAHHARRMGRNARAWNIACDLAINHILEKEAKFVLPKLRLMPGEGEYKDMPPGLSAEEYYRLLPEDAKQGGGQDDPGGCGGVQDPGDGSPADAAEEEADWQVATAQAEAAAKGRGTLTAGLARMCDKVIRPPADWKAVLREFVSRSAKSDFSWSRPNRRFIAQGLYLPGLHSEELGEVLVLVDTSGSIGQDELAIFANELDAIFSTFDVTATVVYHDTEPCKVTEYSTTDGPFTLEPHGGGGTSHKWLADWVAKHNGSPACIVALTDLDTVFGDDPGVPVLWTVTGGYRRAVPSFGRVVDLDL
jgi:predicted metal-dependent peptidase